MNGMQAYLKLVDYPRAAVECGEPAPDAALGHLVAHAHERGVLRYDGPWRLSPGECRLLEDRTGMSPGGGWKGLAGLAAGCGVLCARDEGFVPTMDVEDVAGWSRPWTRRQLLQAFTCALVPPQAAAALFVLLGLHPVWGLRLAHSLHRIEQEAAPERVAGGEAGRARAGIKPGWRDTSLFPLEVLEVLRRGVQGPLGAVVATLRGLKPLRAYPVDALGGVVEAACRLGRRTIGEELEALDAGGVPVFVGHEYADEDFGHPGCGGHDAAAMLRTRYRVVEFATTSLLDQVFVPAGCVRRFDDNTFCTFPAAFDGVRVGALDAAAQNLWLSWMLAGRVDSLVA